MSWTFEHYVCELDQFINQCGIKKCILFGYSWGAALATKYAVEHSDRVEKLILASPYISTSHLIENYRQLTMSKGIYETIIAHEQAGTINSPACQNALKIFFSNFIFRGDASIFDGMTVNKEISETMWGKNELSVTGNLKDLNLIPLLSNLNLPVLLTSGIYDTMTPDYMKLLHEKIKGSQLLIFQNSAHMPHIEEEDEYCRVVQKFLSGYLLNGF